jgi:hypothetical protein
MLLFSFIATKLKSPQIVINTEIRHPLESKSKSPNLIYPYPSGTISSPNYPQNYSNNIVRKFLFKNSLN